VDATLLHPAIGAKRQPIPQPNEKMENICLVGTCSSAKRGEGNQGRGGAGVNRQRGQSNSVTVRRAERLSERVTWLRAELRRLRAENARLVRLATTDALTGVGNRHALRTRLNESVSADRRTGTGTSLLLIDIDHFKAFNDRFGHPAGDRALRRIARLLRGALRQTDFLARSGGEEFVALLPGTDLAGSVEVGERLRQAVVDGPWTGEGSTVSIGAATLGPEPASVRRLLRDADRALYRAKAAGRNRVCSWPQQ
jgi:diguanylate cyclase (GGDEF)-like protein